MNISIDISRLGLRFMLAGAAIIFCCGADDMLAEDLRAYGPFMAAAMRALRPPPSGSDIAGHSNEDEAERMRKSDVALEPITRDLARFVARTPEVKAISDKLLQALKTMASSARLAERGYANGDEAARNMAALGLRLSVSRVFEANDAFSALAQKTGYEMPRPWWHSSHRRRT